MFGLKRREKDERKDGHLSSKWLVWYIGTYPCQSEDQLTGLPVRLFAEHGDSDSCRIRLFRLGPCFASNIDLNGHPSFRKIRDFRGRSPAGFLSK